VLVLANAPAFAVRPHSQTLLSKVLVHLAACQVSVFHAINPNLPDIKTGAMPMAALES
jgi:hypothetical protein